MSIDGTHARHTSDLLHMAVRMEVENLLAAMGLSKSSDGETADQARHAA
jgi:hypothetical protein